ncbi:MAG: T9SS type A sorting domain-containing protein [Fibrobacteres bacterium]|nr:T9SS type A sorting domain-containing protein [Fibrobacterota bacterium]
MNKLKFTFSILLLTASLYSAPVFTAPPASTVTDSGIWVNFTVSEYTDATIEITDNNGKLLRSLASGKLGPKAPIPFIKNSLTQNVFWNRKNDYNEAVFGNFNIKVLLNLGTKFDRIYGFRGENLSRGDVSGISVDTNGNIIIVTSDFLGNNATLLYNRSGQYVRTLLPYPSYHPEERQKGFGRIKRADGKFMPMIFQGHYGDIIQTIAGSTRHSFEVSPQGWVLIGSSNGVTSYLGTRGDHRLFTVGLDGSCPRDTICGPIFPWVTGKIATGAYGSVSPDGQWFYSAGFQDNNRVLNGRVYKTLLNSTTKIDAQTPFISGLVDAHGISTDTAGNIYVCDWGDSAVKIFNAAGTKIASCKVGKPDIVKVNRKNGQIYVLSLDSAIITPKGPLMKISKFSPLPTLTPIFDTAIVWEALVKKKWPVMSIDDRANPPLIWLSKSTYSGPTAYSFQDNGSSIAKTGVEIGKRSADAWAQCQFLFDPGYIAVDREEKYLFAGNDKWTKVDLTTGTLTSSPIRCAELAFDRNNTIYGIGAGNSTTAFDSVQRWNINGTRIPFPDGTMFKRVPTYMWANKTASRGMMFDNKGDLYLHMNSPYARLFNQRMCVLNDSTNNTVDIYDASVNLKQKRVIQLPASAGGLQVNNNGDIYVAYNTKPKGINYPDGIMQLNPQLPQISFPFGSATPWFCDFSPWNYYLLMIGSVYKFSSNGGYIVRSADQATTASSSDLTEDTVPTRQYAGDFRGYCDVSGATWQYYGTSPISALENGGHPTCVCYTPRFAVDGFNRVFIPNAYTFDVRIIDDNRNEITRFGEYGNPDQQGTGSAHPTPEIPLTYPGFVTQINRSIYVADLRASRVVKVKMTYADSATITGTLNGESVNLSKLVYGISAYPNPLTSSTIISGILDKTAKLEVKVYNIQGKTVKTILSDNHNKGRFSVKWDGRNDAGSRLAAGIYMLRVRSGNELYKKELIILK